jgi:DME family drug/metabolite transporter
MIGALLAIVGIAVIFGADLHQGFTFQGAVFAAIAGYGYGYGAFSVAMKQTGASGGLLFTRQLLFSARSICWCLPHRMGSPLAHCL